MSENLSETSVPFPFYVGTYTNGESEGIYKFILHSDGSLTALGLAAVAENPSFLALDQNKQFLVAVNEINPPYGTGLLSSFVVKDNHLEFIHSVSSGGDDPCFVSVLESNHVLTANYTSGTVCLLKLGSDGYLSSLLDVQYHSGKYLNDRQSSPHAHSVWIESSSRTVISLDLGTNQLLFSSIDSNQNKFVPSTPQTLTLDSGAGPRHLAFHPDGKWFYVVNELNSSVTLIRMVALGHFEKGSSFTTLPFGYTDPNTCSDIHLSKDGKFLYVANRGHDSIAVFKISFMSGDLTLLGHKSAGGNQPRFFAFSPDENYLLIANQKSNNIVILERSRKTGLLKYKTQLSAFSPSCIVF